MPEIGVTTNSRARELGLRSPEIDAAASEVWEAVERVLRAFPEAATFGAMFPAVEVLRDTVRAYDAACEAAQAQLAPRLSIHAGHGADLCEGVCSGPAKWMCTVGYGCLGGAEVGS